MNPKPFLLVAIAAARAAGDLLRAGFGGSPVIRQEAGRDIKIQADVEAEHVILGQLRAASDFPILSEESGADPGFSAEGPHWIVDPLDGTLNYSRGIPLACVSIALWNGNEPVLGVVHDFLGNHCHAGFVGEGAWCNDQPLRVSNVTDTARAILATGFPNARDFGDDSLRAFVRDAQQYKKVRLFGSAALSLAHVAAGHVDAYTEEDIWLWDVAAGVALVRAAGGAFTMEPGRQTWQRRVRATNGRLLSPALPPAATRA